MQTTTKSGPRTLTPVQMTTTTSLNLPHLLQRHGPVSKLVTRRERQCQVLSPPDWNARRGSDGACLMFFEYAALTTRPVKGRYESMPQITSCKHTDVLLLVRETPLVGYIEGFSPSPVLGVDC